ncbi:MAG: hypothetical protein HQL44_02130 [Alphaproteobacteria bacterium]|nr:hypothetical protein [Alphaproteobacteria bacterium]
MSENTEESPVANSVQGPTDEAGRAFAGLCWSQVAQRLAVLQGGIDDEQESSGTLPFFLSKAFMARFKNVVLNFVVPAMIEKSQAFVVRAASQRPGLCEAYLINVFEDPKNQLVLNDMWLAAWAVVTVPKKIPPKPEEKSLKDKFRIGQKTTAVQGKSLPTMTLEQWQATSKRIQASNARVKAFLQEVLAERPGYQAPREEDLPTLCSLFVRSNEELQKQITALRQIVEQGGNIGTAYDLYQKNKNIDLALVSACYQYPHHFFDMEKKYLKIMLAGTPERERKDRLPLTIRYLSDLLTP